MNIFVTVGAQIPFDRLIIAVDEWAAGQATGHRLFAQVGEQGYRPVHMEFAELLEPPEFKQRVIWADVLVAHAGMGSILTALQYGKPIMVMPRRGSLRETRNDHQVATAQRFREMGKVAVAMDEGEISLRLNGLALLERSDQISDRASNELVAAVRSFIHDGRERGRNV